MNAAFCATFTRNDKLPKKSKLTKVSVSVYDFCIVACFDLFYCKLWTSNIYFSAEGDNKLKDKLYDDDEITEYQSDHDQEEAKYSPEEKSIAEKPDDRSEVDRTPSPSEESEEDAGKNNFSNLNVSKLIYIVLQQFIRVCTLYDMIMHSLIVRSQYSKPCLPKDCAILVVNYWLCVIDTW